MIQNSSRPYKFETGTLVKWLLHNDRRVHLVDHNSGADICWISNRAWNQPIPVSEWELRKLTRKEFAWYRHPVTGRMMVGRTPSWEWIGQKLASLGCIASAWLAIEDWAGWNGIGRAALLLIGGGRIAIMTYGFFRNYKGLQA